MKSKAIVTVVCCCLLLPLPGGVAAAEWQLQPALTASESWTDNLFNDEHDKESDFVTRIMPSLGVDYEAARVDLNAAYTLDYRYYAEGGRGSETVHFFDGVSLMNHDDWVFLDIRDEYARVSLDAARDHREESLFQDQSDRNLFSISPYLQFRPSFRSRIKGGYRFVRTDYEEESANDKKDSIFFLEGTYDLSDRTTARSGYAFVDEDTSDEDHKKHDLWVGLRTQLGKNTSIFGSIGHTWIDFAGGVDEQDFFWDAGVSHDFGLLVATAALGVTYLEDPEGTILRQENYRLSVSRDWTRSRLAAAVFFSDYFDVAIDELDTRRYGVNASVHHELSPRWNGAAAVSADKFEDPVEDTWTRRLIGRVSISYLFAEDLTATLSYHRIDSHSPEEPDDRYETNQVILEARKVF